MPFNNIHCVKFEATFEAEQKFSRPFKCPGLDPTLCWAASESFFYTSGKKRFGGKKRFAAKAQILKDFLQNLARQPARGLKYQGFPSK